MSLKSWAAKILANRIVPKLYAKAKNAVEEQNKTRAYLTRFAQNTQFGVDHNFSEIQSYTDFKQHIPIRDYEQLQNYTKQLIIGTPNVLWPNSPLYLSKTSGTTSGAKYIPITKESMQHHLDAARNALLCHIYHSKNSDFVKGKMIFLQGSPELDLNYSVPVGRLSGIVANYVPKYLQKNRMPSWETNCISDWETKVEAIVSETLKEDMTLISGIPSWVQMYFEKIKQQTNKPIHEVFPNFNLFVYGGVNFEPYKQRFESLIGKAVKSIELYPASEGFIAFQDELENTGLLLNTSAGIFYEFVLAEDIFSENPKRIDLSEVELDVNYALIINSNAGLWGYNIGDTVKFTSKTPYRIKVTGRTKHFTSAFGEHVIAEEVEGALEEALKIAPAIVSEFSVAPQVNPSEGLPYHEWFIEFERQPIDWELFISSLDKALQAKNPYYRDLIQGNVLRRLIVRVISKNGFVNYMKSEGKLGEQNKIPRLQNTRKLADYLVELSEKTVY